MALVLLKERTVKVHVFILKCLMLLVLCFCIGFTVSYFIYQATKGQERLVEYDNAAGSLRLVVYAKITDDRLSLDYKKGVLESCIRNNWLALNIYKSYGKKDPRYLFYEDKKMMNEHTKVWTQFKEIKERHENENGAKKQE